MRFWVVLNAPSVRALHVGSAAPSSVPQTQQHRLNRDISHKMSAPTVTRGSPRVACDCGALCRWSSRTADSRAVLRPPTACLWQVSMNLGVSVSPQASPSAVDSAAVSDETWKTTPRQTHIWFETTRFSCSAENNKVAQLNILPACEAVTVADLFILIENP